MKKYSSVIEKALRFKDEAHSILGVHEAAPSRIIILERTYNSLGKLSISQDEMFRQSLRCIENSLFRAAHVMAWAGFMDFLEEKLSSDGFTALKAARPKWSFVDVEELRERSTDYGIIEACKVVKLFGKSQMKSLHGLLSKRNECAHPSSYYPDMNQSLGYVSELLTRLKQLQSKSL